MRSATRQIPISAIGAALIASPGHGQAYGDHSQVLTVGVSQFRGVGGSQAVVDSGAYYLYNLQTNPVSRLEGRAVSPPPAAPTFGDVSEEHPFFSFIEALAASGVTGGCGGVNLCPDKPVTRERMAAFLAKAMGLYWPY